MSNVRAHGIRVVQTIGDFTTYHYKSPGVDFECEKLLDKPEELAKLSSKVTTYKKGSKKYD